MNSSKREIHETLNLGENLIHSTHANGLARRLYRTKIDICDDSVKFLIKKQSGNVWPMHCWIHAKNKLVKSGLLSDEGIRI